MQNEEIFEFIREYKQLTFNRDKHMNAALRLKFAGMTEEQAEEFILAYKVDHS